MGEGFKSEERSEAVKADPKGWENALVYTLKRMILDTESGGLEKDDRPEKLYLEKCKTLDEVKQAANDFGVFYSAEELKEKALNNFVALRDGNIKAN